MKRDEKHFCGCLLGGAIGDAFGAPVKFMKYDKIISTYGENGLDHFVIQTEGDKAIITDDTQLTLFTAEGLLRSISRSHEKHIERTKKDTAIVVFRAYLRWLYTQGLRTPNWSKESYDGWLVKVKGLYGYREPGVTCLTALGKGIMGTTHKPINNSKRCGTVIRIAPVGLIEDEETVFDVGCMVGAITHGNPTAYLASGTLATLIYFITEGSSIEEAAHKAMEKLKMYDGHEETMESMQLALQMSKDGEPTLEKLQAFGDGFMANEAVGMALYTALVHSNDFKKAIQFAINQSGNSNSAAAITGNILGAYLGRDGIDEELIEQLEMAKEINQMGKDLYTRLEETEEWYKRYPGW
ncbi:MAG: ADP-ribosylglycohydrolase family protein [Cellulosilyticaceae bacterium]